ncbi:hypothetical protein HN51_045458, partial [Arachis hypogaea]
ISDVGMKAIGEGLSLLQSLDVSYCRKLTDKGLSAVAKGCSDLRKLSPKTVIIWKNWDCKGAQILPTMDLASGCQQIKYLDINKWLSKEKKEEVAGVDGG